MSVAAESLAIATILRCEGTTLDARVHNPDMGYHGPRIPLARQELT